MLCCLTGLASLTAFCLNCQGLVSRNIWPRKAATRVTLLSPWSNVKGDSGTPRVYDGLTAEVKDPKLKPPFSYHPSDSLKALKHIVYSLLSLSFTSLYDWSLAIDTVRTLPKIACNLPVTKVKANSLLQSLHSNSCFTARKAFYFHG